MARADIRARTHFDGYTAVEEEAMLTIMVNAYDNSPTAKAMFDKWFEIKTADHDINITSAALPTGTLGTGKVNYPFSLPSKGGSYIDLDGTAAPLTANHILLHELAHALNGTTDGDRTNLEYKGSNVIFTNKMLKEMGESERIAYEASDSQKVFLNTGFEYTNKVAINAAHAFNNGDWNSSPLGNSRDLLISGSGSNSLDSGPGDDFLFGGGGNDALNGGTGTDIAVFVGAALDYDIRLAADGSWAVRNIRGLKTEGTDTLSNIEQVRFSDGTYDLKARGLTFQTDFAMVIDTTGSMGSSIGSVKAQATALLNAAFANGKADARIGVVGFKDTTAGEASSVILKFTDQDDFAARKAAAVSAINSISVSGGGDIPETAFDGLRVALNGSMGDWRAGAGVMRIALFTDAPAKDGALASTISSLAHNIGGSATAKASFEGAFGSIDTFELTYPSVAADGDSAATFDEPLPAIPYVPSNDPITAVTKGEVQIFTINTGSSSTDMSALSSIATANGGKLLTAASGDDLVKTLVGIIEGTVGTGSTINGTANADTLVGGAGDDTINGLGANDTLTGAGGDDKIDGGTGTDTAKYSGVAKNYKISFTVGGSSVTVQDKVGTDGTDTLSNIETIQFSNMSIDPSWLTKTASLSSAQLASLTQIYIASFNRAPDSAGLEYWGSRYKDGMTLPDIAKSFFVQPEAAVDYPAGQTTNAFVTKVYGNVLGRSPDTAGLSYWTGELQNGHVGKDTFLLAMINGALALGSGNPDTQYLNNKTSVGIHYALTEGLNDFAHAKSVMTGVTSSSSSVTAANNLVDSYAASTGGSELVMQIVGIVA